MATLASMAYSQLDMKCLEQYCKTEYLRCTESEMCKKTLECVTACTKIIDPTPQKTTLQTCVNKCSFTYGDEAYVGLLSCLDTNKCLKLPPIQAMCKGPDHVKLQKNITLDMVAGATVWTLRGYNKVYDCYACQVNTFSKTTYTSSFEAEVIGGSLKPEKEEGTITDLAPQPGFNVTIRAGLTLVNTFWIFDQIDQYFLVYYCGYGNTWSYEGALVLSAMKEISVTAMPLIRSSFERSVGIDFDGMCRPDTTTCN